MKDLINISVTETLKIPKKLDYIIKIVGLKDYNSSQIDVKLVSWFYKS